MYNIGSIKINITKVDQSKYQLYLLFNGNSMSIFLGKEFNYDINCIVSETIGSEHWMSDISDYFRFDKNGDLHTIILGVPNINKAIDLVSTGESNIYDLRLIENPMYCTVEETKIRNFNLSSKTLVCTYGIDGISDSEIKMLNSDFGLIFNEKKYVGYLINDPLRYFADSYGKIDLNSPTSAEYALFDTYLKIMSDNNLKQHNGSIEEVVKQLSTDIIPELKHHNNRRMLDMEHEIRELIDFWL